MTRRKTLLVVSGVLAFLLLLTAVGLFTYLFKPQPAPKLAFALVSVNRIPLGYIARVAVTNVSDMTLQYDQRRTARIRIETKAGWITNGISMEPILRIPILLPPGFQDVERVRLPDGALRFQLQYTLPSLSSVDTFRQKFPKAGARVQSLVSRALSNKPGHPFEIESEIFKIPQDLPVPEEFLSRRPINLPERGFQQPSFPPR